MATMGRPRQFDRDEALQNAMSLFWRYGYESTSMTQLRQAMGGISAASLYAAFESKESLYREAIGRYLKTSAGQIINFLNDSNLEPVEAITQALRNAVREQTRDAEPRGCMVVLSATNCSPENEHIQREMMQQRKRTRLAFRDCIQRGIESGSLSTQTDADTLSLLLSTILNGISIQARDGFSEAELNKALDLSLSTLHAELASTC